MKANRNVAPIVNNQRESTKRLCSDRQTRPPSLSWVVKHDDEDATMRNEETGSGEGR